MQRAHNPYRRRRQYSDALKFRPDVVIVNLDTNDLLALNWGPLGCIEFARDYADLVAEFRGRNPAAEVFLCLPNVRGLDFCSKAAQAELLATIREVAVSVEAAGLIDLDMGASDLCVVPVQPSA